MSKYYNPSDGRHIPNPMLRTCEWARSAHVVAPKYDGSKYICRYDGQQWVLEPNTENQTVEISEREQRNMLISEKLEEMALVELIKEGKLSEDGKLIEAK